MKKTSHTFRRYNWHLKGQCDIYRLLIYVHTYTWNTHLMFSINFDVYFFIWFSFNQLKYVKEYMKRPYNRTGNSHIWRARVIDWLYIYIYIYIYIYGIGSECRKATLELIDVKPSLFVNNVSLTIWTLQSPPSLKRLCFQSNIKGLCVKVGVWNFGKVLIYT